jgi:phage gpG-like protein
MSVSLTIDISDLDIAIDKLKPLTQFQAEDLMSAVGALGESQTRRRITDEKTAPDGAAWQQNAEGTSILQRTGNNLLDSIAFTFDTDEAVWGAAWEHAHVHQEGMTIEPKNGDRLFFKIGGKTVAAKKVTIPARPIVGLSDENRADIRELATDFLGLGGLQ